PLCVPQSFLRRQHLAALNWFRDNAGRNVSWPEIKAQAALRTRLVTQEKGIYKPHYMEAF
ncbi:hypothetical protein ACC722_39295, partial [Rhizobium ruizarguesonis]